MSVLHIPTVHAHDVSKQIPREKNLQHLCWCQPLYCAQSFARITAFASKWVRTTYLPSYMQASNDQPLDSFFTIL